MDKDFLERRILNANIKIVDFQKDLKLPISEDTKNYVEKEIRSLERMIERLEFKLWKLEKDSISF